MASPTWNTIDFQNKQDWLYRHGTPKSLYIWERYRRENPKQDPSGFLRFLQEVERGEEKKRVPDLNPEIEQDIYRERLQEYLKRMV